MQNELDVVRDVDERLSQLGIGYMLTGSLAMNYYAEPRMTRDVDIVAALKSKDVERLCAAFGDDYYIDSEAVSRAIARSSLFNVINNRAFVKVDFIVQKDTEFRHVEFNRRRRVTMDGIPVWLVSKEDLIISKLYWAKDSHSELQLRDVKNLLNSGCDADYLESWTRKLELHELLKECLYE
jgi:predicted nucleotidyltransferase